MNVRFTMASVLVFCACVMPALADRAPPAIDPLALARAQLLARATLDQTVRLSAVKAFSLDKGAHTAQLSGTGAASLDGGATVVGNKGTEVTVNVTVSNADDPAFAQCRDSLAQDVPGRGPVNISGHGYFNLNMLNGALTAANLTLDVVTSCDPGG